jgi:chromosome segregation ATPase
MKTSLVKKTSNSVKKPSLSKSKVINAAAFGSGALLGATSALILAKKLKGLDKTNPDNFSIESYQTELENNLLNKQVNELKEQIKKEQENNKKLLEDIDSKTKELSRLTESHKKERESNIDLVSKITACNKGYSELKQRITKERDSNSELSRHIRDCNKEIIRMRGLVSKSPDLSREAKLRNTLSKFITK